MMLELLLLEPEFSQERASRCPWAKSVGAGLFGCLTCRGREVVVPRWIDGRMTWQHAWA